MRREHLLDKNLRDTATSKTLSVVLSSRIHLSYRDRPGQLTFLQQHIRYLLSTGKTQWESMERYIDGM